MSVPCDCEHIHPRVEDSAVTDLGMDMRNGRSAQVLLHRCRRCGAQWLHYRVEYEAFSESDRWFCGRVDESTAASASASNAIGTLAGLAWYWAGGSYFGGEVGRGSGPVPVDVYGPPALE